MMLRYIIALFAFAIGRVWASDHTAPFEALTFYYAYRMEYEAFPGNEEQAFLCNDCFYEIQGRPATFDEFAQRVLSNSGGYGGGFNPDDPKYATPKTREVITQMARDLAGEGFSGVHFNFAKLYWGGDNFYYDRMIKSIIWRVQQARRSGVTTNLDAVQHGVWGIHMERVADEFPDAINGIRDDIKAKTGIDVVINQDNTNPLGDRRYPDIDWSATATNMHTNGATQNQIETRLNQISDAVHTYQGSDHYKNIIVVKDCMGKLVRPC